LPRVPPFGSPSVPSRHEINLGANETQSRMAEREGKKKACFVKTRHANSTVNSWQGEDLRKCQFGKGNTNSLIERGNFGLKLDAFLSICHGRCHLRDSARAIILPGSRWLITPNPPSTQIWAVVCLPFDSFTMEIGTQRPIAHCICLKFRYRVVVAGAGQQESGAIQDKRKPWR
jgi:hypothetical protein